MISVFDVFGGILIIGLFALCIAIPILILWWMYDTHKAVREILEELRSLRALVKGEEKTKEETK